MQIGSFVLRVNVLNSNVPQGSNLQLKNESM